MDPKELAKLRAYHDKLNALTFDEDLVALLLMALRPYADKGQPVHEFADFIAHRARDRGVIFDHLRRISADPLLFAIQSYHSVPPGPKPVFTEREVHTSFNREFARHGLPFIASEASAAALLCIMSLLQRAVMKLQRGGEFAQLVIAVSRDGVFLQGDLRLPDDSSFVRNVKRGFEEAPIVFSFPVLAVENVFVGVEGETLMLPNVDTCIEIKYENGKPRIVGLEELRHGKHQFVIDPQTETVRQYKDGHLVDERRKEEFSG